MVYLFILPPQLKICIFEFHNAVTNNKYHLLHSSPKFCVSWRFTYYIYKVSPQVEHAILEELLTKTDILNITKRIQINVKVSFIDTNLIIGLKISLTLLFFFILNTNGKYLSKLSSSINNALIFKIFVKDNCI